MIITGYSVAGVIEADPDSQFVWVKFVDAQTVTDVAVAAAEQRGYKRGEQEIREDERERCRAAVLDHFKVAPLAAEPILRRIG